MRTRELGRTGIELPVIGLGCMGFDFAYGRAPREVATAVIHRAISLGVNHLDTADMYGPFANEELVGRSIAGRRDQVVLATKCGLITHDATTYEIERDGRPEHIRRACDESLRRLGVDAIDLYYLHRVDPCVPIEESVGALSELVGAGKVRAIGLSEVDIPTLDRAVAVHPISALQSEFSLWTREPVHSTLPWCGSHGVTFVAYSPLGRGFLTGRYRDAGVFGENDFRRQLPRFQPDALQQNLPLADLVEHLAAKKTVPAGNVALAWVLAQGEHVVAIPGTKRLEFLLENAAAAEMVLDADELELLDTMPDAVGSER